jgi:hypothetical protein
MLLRELSESGNAPGWQLYVTDTVLVEERENGGSTHWHQSSPASGVNEFEKMLNGRLKQGWKETERSLSRRVFRHDGKAPGKFWIIWLDKNSVAVQYG